MKDALYKIHRLLLVRVQTRYGRLAIQAFQPIPDLLPDAGAVCISARPQTSRWRAPICAASPAAPGRQGLKPRFPEEPSTVRFEAVP